MVIARRGRAEQLAELTSVPCTRCGAKVGEPCRTLGGGNPLPLPNDQHAVRWHGLVARRQAAIDARRLRDGWSR